MKKILFFLLLAVVFQSASSQMTLRMCKTVSSDGQPIGNARNAFLVYTGEELKMLLNSSKAIGTTRLEYKIYKMGCTGIETYDNTFYADIQSDWVWVSKGIKFNQDGFYYIKVYNNYGTFLAETLVHIMIDDEDW